MLVLRRRVGEGIIIQGDIHITVMTIKGDKVHLGITAPKDIRVDRQEVYEQRMGMVAELAQKELVAVHS